MIEEAVIMMQLVDKAIVIDKRMKEDKKNLDELKARLSTVAFAEIENKSLKFKQIFGSNGHFTAAYKEKFELDNYDRLIEIVGEIGQAKITRTAKQDVKYDVDDRFKAALIALYNDDYSKEISVEQILTDLHLDSKTAKMAAKKLKGDYLKDKRTLESIGIDGDREEELDAIRRYRNWELVNHFFSHLSPAQLEELKRTIWIENQLAAGLEYQK